MKHVYLCILPLLLAVSPRLGAQEFDQARPERWYMPHYVPVQFAGNIGLFSLGLGYASNHDNYHINFLYGYVPSSVARAEIHTITAKNIFPLTRYGLKSNRTIIPYVGVGLTMEVGGNSFFRMPDHFPKGYYDVPKNIHVIAYGGARLQQLFDDDFKILRGLEFYAETGSVDVYLWYKATSNQIKLHNIFSLALGVNILLRH